MKKIFALIAGFVLVAGLASCNKDFLETSPTDAYAQDFVMSSTDNIEAALNGMHKAMVSQYFSRQNIGGIPSFQIAMDCFGEDLVFPAAGNGWWTNTGEVKWTNNRNPDSWVVYYPFTISYKMISNANMILDYVDEATGPDPQKEMLKGQALAYRAYFYFWLVQLYADRYDPATAATAPAVPLVTTTLESTMKPIATVEKVYEQITGDLDRAILYLDPANAYTAYTSKCDIDRAVALGIRARVALVMGDWPKAKQCADDAIAAAQAAGRSLMSATDYTDGFNDCRNPEWMWGFTMIDDQSLYFYGYMAYMSWNFNSTNVRSAPKCINSQLYDAIPDTDVRKGLFDPTGTAWTMPSSSYQRFPYMNRKFAVKNPSSSVADANFMRLGEMYLIAAEAAAKSTGDAAQYLYDLNVTRDPSYTKSTATGDDLLEEIYLYRRIELWGEGHRFLDLKRLNQALDRTGANHVVAVSQVMTLPADDVKWKYAIPREEIDANDFITNAVND